MINVTEQDIKEYFQVIRNEIIAWRKSRVEMGFRTSIVTKIYEQDMDALDEEEKATLQAYSTLKHIEWGNSIFKATK